jgi:hypothetical protein
MQTSILQPFDNWKAEIHELQWSWLLIFELFWSTKFAKSQWVFTISSQIEKNEWNAPYVCSKI